MRHIKCPYKLHLNDIDEFVQNIIWFQKFTRMKIIQCQWLIIYQHRLGQVTMSNVIICRFIDILQLFVTQRLLIDHQIMQVVGTRIVFRSLIKISLRRNESICVIRHMDLQAVFGCVTQFSFQYYISSQSCIIIIIIIRYTLIHRPVYFDEIVR